MEKRRRTAVLAAVLVLLWLVSGYTGYLYLRTRDADLTVDHAVFGILPALSGPLIWGIVWSIYHRAPHPVAGCFASTISRR